MKAIVQTRYGGPEALELADVPRPIPAAGEVLLRVLACSVNLSDWEYLVGSPFYARLSGGLLRPRKAILGSDIVGTIEQLGPDVTGLSVGDRVMCDLVMSRGGFAEYASVPAKELAPVPDALSDEVAACLPQAGGIAVTGTEGLTSRDRLLINGAGGGSGTMAIQLAKAAGAHVTAVDHSGKLEFLSALGADDVIDYTRADFATTGKSWTRILDMVATRGPIAIARSLERGGTYHAAGGLVRTLLALIFGGLAYRASGRRIGILIVPGGRDLTGRVAQLAADGALSPRIEEILPLSAVPEALRRTGAGEVKGKLVIRP